MKEVSTNFSPKGRLEVGDRVRLSGDISEETRQLLSDLDGSTVLSVDGDMLTLVSNDGSLRTEMHRKYFCLLGYISHWDNPCLLCGYDESN